MGSRGDVTRRTIVETAERLFAERGIETVSLRDVSAAAGQRNHSAAQYHFGDRAGLVAATIAHRMSHVNERRLARLALTEDADVGGIVAAIVVPLVEIVEASAGWYGRFLARVQWDPFATGIAADLDVFTSYRHANRLLDAALDLPVKRRHSRIEQLTSLVIGTIAHWEDQRDRGAPRLDADDLADDLAATGTALVLAPISVPSR